MRKPLLGFLTVCCVMLCASPNARAASIIYSSEGVVADGRAYRCDLYNIDGCYYIGVRDFGNATGVSVDYDVEKQAVVLSVQSVYVPEGETGIIEGDQSSTAAETEQNFLIERRLVANIPVWNIGGKIYAQLAALAEHLYYTLTDGVVIHTNGLVDAPLTRASMARLLVDAYELSYDESMATSFEDVSPAASYYEAISICVSMGVMGPRSERYFSPESTMTRAEAAVILYRAGLPDGVPEEIPSDVPADSWYYEGVCAALSAGAMSVRLNGTFEPHNVAYRSEIRIVDTDASLAGLMLNVSEISLGKGDKAYLTARPLPVAAVLPALAWTSSDDSVAVVSSTGRVKAVGVGTATITVSGGGFSADCVVAVSIRAPNEYRIGTLIIRDTNGEQLSAIPSGPFLVTVPITKQTGGGDVMVFLAAYGAEGRYRGLLYVELEDVPVGTTLRASLFVNNSDGGIARLKAFPVVSFDHLIPIGSVSKLSNN